MTPMIAPTMAPIETPPPVTEDEAEGLSPGSTVPVPPRASIETLKASPVKEKSRAALAGFRRRIARTGASVEASFEVSEKSLVSAPSTALLLAKRATRSSTCTSTSICKIKSGVAAGDPKRRRDLPALTTSFDVKCVTTPVASCTAETYCTLLVGTSDSRAKATRSARATSGSPMTSVVLRFAIVIEKRIAEVDSTLKLVLDSEGDCVRDGVSERDVVGVGVDKGVGEVDGVEEGVGEVVGEVEEVRDVDGEVDGVTVPETDGSTTTTDSAVMAPMSEAAES